MRIKKTVFANASYLCKLQAKLSELRHRHAAHFRHLKEVFYEKLWTGTARDLGAEIKAIGYGFYELRLHAKTTLVHGSEVMLDSHLNLKLAGNKPLISKILSEHHYPVARYHEFDLAHLDEAYEFLAGLARPCVVKPAGAGSAGKGITTGILTRGELSKAALWASCYSQKLIIENQVEGDSYRLLYLHGRFLDAIRRLPPRVHGDGKHTIQELIVAENHRRMNPGAIISLHPLAIDAELKNHLRATGYHLKHVLAKGKSIAAKRVVNQNSRYENESVRAIVHPEIIKSGEHIARLLQIELAGIDLICKDITRPLAQENGVVNEVNTTPALHHHYLISNTSEITPVAVHIQRYILNGKD
ncbi:MAG: cyanophycin synthetase [bacterium]